MMASGLRSMASVEQLVEQPPELEIIFQHIGNADDRVLRQVKGQLDSGGGHLRAARAEETAECAGIAAWLRRGSSAETSSAASKSPLASPAMSMKIFGFTAYISATEWRAIVAHGVNRGKRFPKQIQAPAGAKENSFP